MKLSTNQKILVRFAILLLILITVLALRLVTQSPADFPPEEASVEENNKSEPSPSDDESGQTATGETPDSSPVSAPPSTQSASSSKRKHNKCQPVLSAQRIERPRGISLKWTVCEDEDFQFYRLVKSVTQSNPTYPADPVIMTSNNKNEANYIDAALQPSKTYFYRLCVFRRVNRMDCSNVASAEF